MSKSPAPDSVLHSPSSSGSWDRSRKYWMVVAAIIIAGLLYIAFRRAPLTDIWMTLRRLQAWQILVLLGTDAVIYLLVTARWWLIIHAQNELVPYLSLLPVRLAVFGVSYFTIGPLVGGEPLQVFFLQHEYGLTYTRATASVIMDKLLEFLANFLLLVFGLTAVFHLGIISGISQIPPIGLALLVGLAAWPLVHVVLLNRGYYPISTVLGVLPHAARKAKFVRFLRAAEHLAGQFCQRYPRALAACLLVSVMAAAGTLFEYSLILNFLNIVLSFWQIVSAWTVSWLSFLIPLPGGLGALEAGQVFTLHLFGISAATALAVTLIIRSRDILIGGLGLAFGWNMIRRA